jgi:WD40 repeat protein
VPLPDALVTDLPPDSPVTVAGWSADGTRLALSSEHSGRNYVVDADGTVLPHRTDGGCCWFVSTPWLSPDGTTALEGADVDTLRMRDVRTDGVRTLRLEPQLGDPGTVGISPAAWSPDGSRVALLVSESDGTAFLPSIAVVDRTTGSARQVLRQVPGHIRQVSWSPDGSRLLVIAGPWSDSTELENLNPLVHPKETGVYLVPVDLPVPAMRPLPGPIARGHFVAATWSGDGDRIAAIDFTPTNRRLVVMDADGSGSRVLAELPSNELFTGLAWHPATTVSGAR